MSEIWIFIGLLVLGVAITFPVVMFILWALVSIAPKRRELCTACGQRRLLLVRLVRGRPRAWSYFLCESCGARYKQHLRGDFEIASGQEWALLVDPGTLFAPRDTSKGESCADLVTPVVKKWAMHSLNSELRFPKPPFRIEPSAVDSLLQGNSVSSYLDQIRLWHLAVLAFIDNSGGKPAREREGLTERAQEWLATFLASHWTSGMTNYAMQSPYNISPFPASALEAVSNPTMESVFEVLRWRAALDDFLSDVCDVIGEPDLNIYECAAIGEFLDPIGKEKLCDCCLTELAPEQRNSGGHDCMFTSHVQAKWPPTPPIFAKWEKEARTQEPDAGTDRPPLPAP